MSNHRYVGAINRLIDNFKRDFIEFSRSQYTNESGALVHPGEFGHSREKICRTFIENILPSSRAIGTNGLVISANNEISKEQDLIFYSRTDTPVLTLDTTGFFPIETVVGIGQIKSIVRSKAELKEILDNLTAIKMMRENMGHDSVVWRGQDLWNGRSGYFPEIVFDQVCTFLICEKLDFEVTADDIDSMYGDVPNHLKHNMILDITNGVFGYRTSPTDPLIGIPKIKSGNVKPAYIKQGGENEHLKNFLANLQILIPGATVFHPDMGVYLK